MTKWTMLIVLLMGVVLTGEAAETASLTAIQDNRHTNSTCNMPGQYATIQAAVDDNTCSLIVVAAGSHPDAVAVDRTVTIRGVDRDTTQILNAVTVASPDIFENIVLTLEDITILDSPSHGVSLGSPFADLVGNNIEINNSAQWGVFREPAATDGVITLNNSIVTLNRAGIRAGRLLLDGTTVDSNMPLGGISMRFGTILNSNIINNELTGPNSDGAGILIGDSSTPTIIEDTVISFNELSLTDPMVINTQDGGGIAVEGGILRMKRSLVSFNQAGRYGGGISTNSSLGGVAEIEDSVISNNSAYSAGGGVSAGGRVELKRTTVVGNSAALDQAINANGEVRGGGIYTEMNGVLTIEDSTIKNNAALIEDETMNDFVGQGGGLYLDSQFAVRLNRVTIHNNEADYQGGGLYVVSNIADRLTLTNLTIVDNHADVAGGGVFGVSDALLKHGTVVGNSVDGDGGGVAGSLTVDHTLIAHNADTSSSPNNQPDCTSTVFSAGQNVTRIADGCTALGQSPNVFGTLANPLKVNVATTLADNGGFVETLALLADSPALDGGVKGCEDDTAVDARGYGRVGQDGNGDGGSDNNPCDIGAYEESTAVPTAIVLRGLGAESSSRLQPILILLSTAVLLSMCAARLRAASLRKASSSGVSVKVRD